MARAGVEERWRAGQIVERSHESVKLDGFGNSCRQAAGDAQKEILRRLNHLPRDRMAQQISVIDGAQAEVFEAIGKLIIDRIIEFSRVRKHKFRKILCSDAFALSNINGREKE